VSNLLILPHPGHLPSGWKLRLSWCLCSLKNDVETFLISFEKAAELNNFPPEKSAAILQAHLTGKALKVFLLSVLLSNVGTISIYLLRQMVANIKYTNQYTKKNKQYTV